MTKTSLGCCRSQTVATAMVENTNQDGPDPLNNKNKPRSGLNGNDPASKMCPSCHTDLSERNSSSAAQHIRRCNAPPPQSDGYPCTICNNKYKTYAGLRQHQRRSHPEEYNSADLQLLSSRQSSSRSQYTESEIKAIAELEVTIPQTTKLLNKDIIKILSEKTGRPIEGIKKLRQRETYKSLVADGRKQKDITPNSPEPPKTSEGGDDSPRTDPPRSNNTNNNSTNLPNRTLSPIRSTTQKPAISLIESEDIRKLLKQQQSKASPEMSAMIDKTL